MSEKSKGTLCGIVAAVSYGMNPLGALSLYRAGINTNSVLFYRYALAAVLLAALLLVQKTSLRITRREFSVLGLLGVMFAVSSLTLFMSFHYMDAGIASTLLFVYPVMVAVIMAIFFRSEFRWSRSSPFPWLCAESRCCTGVRAVRYSILRALCWSWLRRSRMRSISWWSTVLR